MIDRERVIWCISDILNKVAVPDTDVGDWFICLTFEIYPFRKELILMGSGWYWLYVEGVHRGPKWCSFDLEDAGASSKMSRLIHVVQSFSSVSVVRSFPANGSSIPLALLSVANEMPSASSLSKRFGWSSSIVVDGGNSSKLAGFPAFLLLLRLPSAVQWLI